MARKKVLSPPPISPLLAGIVGRLREERVVVHEAFPDPSHRRGGGPPVTPVVFAPVDNGSSEHDIFPRLFRAGVGREQIAAIRFTKVAVYVYLQTAPGVERLAKAGFREQIYGELVELYRGTEGPTCLLACSRVFGLDPAEKRAVERVVYGLNWLCAQEKTWDGRVALRAPAPNRLFWANVLDARPVLGVHREHLLLVNETKRGRWKSIEALSRFALSTGALRDPKFWRTLGSIPLLQGMGRTLRWAFLDVTYKQRRTRCIEVRDEADRTVRRYLDPEKLSLGDTEEAIPRQWPQHVRPTPTPNATSVPAPMNVKRFVSHAALCAYQASRRLLVSPAPRPQELATA